MTPLPLSLAELLALPLAEAQSAVEQVSGPALPFVAADALPPVDEQEVWAAGVTYRRSRDGRIEESGNETLYDHVYASARPEIFFKATPARVVTDGQPVGIRADSDWDVPEAEIGLVINAGGEIVGYLAGNDMSSRSIEGENALYLPQAKMYEASCALSASIHRCGRRRRCRSACRSPSAGTLRPCTPPRPVVMPCSARSPNLSPGSCWPSRSPPEPYC